MDFLCHSIFSEFVLQGFVRNIKSTLFSKVYRVYCKGIFLFIHKNHEGPSKQEGFKKTLFFCRVLLDLQFPPLRSRLMLGIFWFPNDQVLNEVLQGLSNDQLPTFALELLAQAQTGEFT